MNSRLCGPLVLVLVCLMLSAPLKVSAQDDRSHEYQVKAAILYNFARFVEWPAEAFDSPEAPISLCVLGANPYGQSLSLVENKPVRGRRLSVRLCKSVKEVQNCHILFICASEKERLQKILSSLDGQPILTVSDIKDFARQGGGINLIKSDNKIRFEINLDAAQQPGLKISSQLLKLAEVMR